MPHASQLSRQDIAHMQALQAAFSDAENHLHTLKSSKISLELIQEGADAGGAKLSADDVGKLNSMVKALHQASGALETAIHTFRDMSSLDDLTRLYSRKHVLHLLEKELNRARRYDAPFAVLSLHIQPAESLTLSTLDKQLMLAEVGRVVNNRVREADAPARMGDDTFLILLPETPAEGAEILAKRLMDDLENTALDFSSQESTLCPSIALLSVAHKTEASLGEALLTLDNLLQAAQAATPRFAKN